MKRFKKNDGVVYVTEYGHEMGALVLRSNGRQTLVHVTSKNGDEYDGGPTWITTERLIATENRKGGR